MIVLSRGWFAYQVAHTPGRIKLKVFTDNALLRFTNKLILDISGTRILQASLRRYFDLDDKPKLVLDEPAKAKR